MHIWYSLFGLHSILAVYWTLRVCNPCPDPWADPKSRFAIGVYDLHQRCVELRIGVSTFLDPPGGLGIEACGRQLGPRLAVELFLSRLRKPGFNPRQHHSKYCGGLIVNTNTAVPCS